jgi:hypothetical protein
MKRFYRLFLVSIGLLAAIALSGSVSGDEFGGWKAPNQAAPGLEIQGDARVWQRENVKALDKVYDGASGRAAVGDLMGFYFDQEVDRLSFRVSLFRPIGKPETKPVLDPGVRVFVLMDYAPGGRTDLPGGTTGTSPIAWDRAVELTEADGRLSGRILDTQLGEGETQRIRKTIASPRWSMLEASLWLPDGFKEAVAKAAGESLERYDAIAPEAARSEATPIGFYVFTARDGRLLDDIVASNSPMSNSHNVAFVHHLNQGLTYTTVFRGERGENAAYDGDPNNPDDGADELLAAHDYYNLPLNWHQGGLLISAAEWHDPGFNDWLAAGVSAGRYEILTSALGQHIMPFLSDAVNGKAVSVENDMIQTHYGYTPRVAWVPERVWCENPDIDGNAYDASQHVIDQIGDDFTDNGVWAVVLDDYIHCGYRNNAFDDHHIYTYSYAGGSIKVLPNDNDFVGQVNWNPGDAWNTILAGTSDEIIIYANDAEVAAEVAQGAGNPDALNNYIWLLQQIAGAGGSIGTWKLTSVLTDGGFGENTLTLQNGTYGLLGGFYGYGGYAGNSNAWYGDWASYTGDSNLDAHMPKWDYGTQWAHTLGKCMAGPVNNLNEMSWYVLMTNLHETGWHDSGEISGWEHHYSNHIRSGNAHAEAARWAGGLYANPTGAYTSDFDDDGTDELVMYNDRVLAVFDPIGGKLQWLFCKGSGYNYSVVSNDNVYWADTDGDYNETNHVATLSDVSVGGIDREHDYYSFNVLTASGNTVEAEVIHPSVTKTISLTLGDPYLKVLYEAYGQRIYIKNGFTPDNLDLTWSGKSLYRVWDPDGGSYFGQRNTNTAATAAIIAGTAGAHHNQQYEATLLEVDEFYGDSKFEVYVYGGSTTAPDVNGRIAELEALSDSLVDRWGPVPLSGTEFPATDQLVIYFDEDVDASSVVVTGFSFDDDDDGIADVTLTASDSLTNTGFDDRLNFSLSAASANAIEALTGDIELMLAASSVTDTAGNGNDAIDNQDNVPIDIAPVTKVQIDGHVSDSDWQCTYERLDDLWDSTWNGAAPGDTNEILVLFADWDSTYFYVGIRGHVQGNSWILYLDTDVDGPAGYTDLTAIDTWERGATFSATGFKPDYQMGAYQHQSAYDGQSMWRLLSPTTSENISGQVYMAFDPQHTYGYEGGSEIAIPWDVLYGLGPGEVPVGTKIGLVVSVCWDPEPNGELGGDSAPNNITATLPEIDNFLEVDVDQDNNGIPDQTDGAGVDVAAVATGTRLLSAYPSPSSSTARVPLVLDGPRGANRSTHAVEATVFDISGRRVRTVFQGGLSSGSHTLTWDGKGSGGEAVAAGIYFMRVTVDGRVIGSAKMVRLP